MSISGGTTAEDSESAISIEATGLGKSYQVRRGGKRRETFWANQDVSFKVRKGEVLGIIGRNGSGKTTLLKILCSVSPPTVGSAVINGKISAMLGVGTGMHPMMTGRENAYFAGMVLGLDRDFIDSRLDSIIEFSGIGDFINRPVKTYSSGMRSRLGFAIAAQIEPEILLLDEVLAVGDLGFQQKCLARIREMRAAGSTILIVTHNMNVVKSFCDSALLLDAGRVISHGDPDEVVAHYLEDIIGQTSTVEGDGEGTRGGSGVLHIEDHWLEDVDGKRIEAAQTGKPATLCLSYSCSDPAGAKDVSVGIAIADNHGRWLSRVATDISAENFEHCFNLGVLRCAIADLPFSSGTYRFGFRILSEGEVADYIVDFGKFDVIDGDFFGTGEVDPYAPVMVKHEWSIEPDTASL